MHRRSSVLLVCGAAAAALSACGSPLQPSCAGSVQLSIAGNASTIPTLSWKPGCELTEIDVDDTTTHTKTWQLQSIATAGISPPVVYGTLPSGADAVGALKPMVAGHSYLISLSVITDDGADIGLATMVYTPTSGPASTAAPTGTR